MFGRGACKIMVYDKAVPLEDIGRAVQINGSKVGKQKYNRGHRVEGQWMFGGLKEFIDHSSG